jgi:WD40 repeat protein
MLESSRYPFRPKIWQSLKPEVLAMFHGKCAFSEVSLREPGDVAHFRPKTGAIDLAGNSSPLHYCWLAYTWENLYPISRMCDTGKGARFPVARPRSVFGMFDEDLLESGKEVLMLMGHRGVVTGVAFNADGTQLASSSWDRTIRIWRAPRPRGMR